MNYSKLYKKAVDSVVLITTDNEKGTGFVVRNDGLILTNQHVVYPFETVSIQFKNGLQCLGRVINSNRTLDLAGVFPIIENKINLRPLTLGVFSSIEIGIPIIAIGHPTNSGNFSIIQGIVSASNETEDTVSGLLQLNISANCGMSGGPVICINGTVIGILTNLIYSGQERIEGISEALPINCIIPFLQTVPTFSQKVLSECHYCTVCGNFVANTEYCWICGVAFINEY